MKIIGRTSGGFIAEISDRDVAALVGETYAEYGEAPQKIAAAFGHPPTRPGDRINLIGAEIDLAGRFRRTIDIEQRHADLGKTAESLRLLATALDAVATAPLTLPKGE